MTMSEYHKNVYANIEFARNQKGMSKGELANEIGISKPALSFVLNRLKNGRTINTKTLEKWAEALNVPFSFFFEIKRNSWNFWKHNNTSFHYKICGNIL